ncbi:MAG: RNA polymerase subunit sigma-54 [Planctomycetota bacterium]|nr:MAG: RNA polymerase subunit sigma-54 [Planctomycetota bacterium]
MEIPLEIISRDVRLPEAAETEIRGKAEKLGKAFSKIQNIRVVVEVPHRHQHKGNHYKVGIYVLVPGQELVVNREPGDEGLSEGLRPAYLTAFQSMQRKLHAYADKRRKV